LISEAVRGEGATLLNSRGERFMQKYDVKGELAPRDIVARAIFQEMKETGSDHVSLRLAQLDPETIRRRFPVIYKTCLERGLDITKDNIPVAPAAHYFMGGIKTDVNGKTDIASLYAAGECAALGVHGANRLASNSLLDGLVFGHRAALTAKNETQAVGNFSFDSNPLGQTNLSADKIQRLKLTIKSCMWNEVGIVRSADSLLRSFKIMQDLSRQLTFSAASKDEIELKNMHLVAWLITRAAFDRKESRGAHYRSDFPTHSDVDWQRHLVYKKG
jgi:L-aspartate oxidase